MNASVAMDTLLQASASLINRTGALLDFAPVPDDLELVPRAPVLKPVTEYIASHLPPSSPNTQALVDAVLAAAPHAEWRTTYSADQVGADFVNRYGYIELYGPDGHYISHQSRAFIGYWGSRLHYPPHHHEAEELYYVIAGEAHFATDNSASRLCGVDESQYHHSNQSHSMITNDRGVLCLVLWRGAGLDRSARLND